MRAGGLRCEGIRKEYATGPSSVAVVLDGIDLHVGSGDAVAVIGRNGAGKSTLLRLAAGISAPTSGTIGRPARTYSMIELAAGHQPELTGRENAEIGLALAGLGAKERRRAMPQVADLAGIGDAFDTPVKRYSSGMLARLGFAVGIATEPDLLLIDEVLAVGDLEFQRRAISETFALTRRGGSLVLVTHNLALAERACGRAVWIENGVVAADGPTRAVVATYQHAMASVVAVEQSHTAVRLVATSTPSIGPGDPLGLTVELDRADGAPPVDLVVELRPPVEDVAWTELDKEFNVVARSAPFGPVAATGGHRLDVVLPAVRITPSELDVVVVVLDHRTRSPIAESGLRIHVGGEPGLPRLVISATGDGLPDAQNRV